MTNAHKDLHGLD